jgi:hypothetical protein
MKTDSFHFGVAALLWEEIESLARNDPRGPARPQVP